MSQRPLTILWWGRSDHDYSRNRLLRRLLREMGHRLVDFRPRFSALGHWQARWTRLPLVDLVWVPAFRQRDLAAALRWARRHGVPVLADPLISAYDKQVFERGKFPPDHPRAQRLRDWEASLLQACDLILADTPAHAAFFHHTLGVPSAKLAVVYVGADETLFTPQPLELSPNEPPEVLFYGSFLPLQGPETIIEAAAHYQGPPMRLTLLGDGPLKERCVARVQTLPPSPTVTLRFEPPIPYAALPERIARAAVVLGVFGDTPKADRVIPNKVFQALAMGRAVITRRATAHPAALLERDDQGIFWIEANDATALAQQLATLCADPAALTAAGQHAAATFRAYFAEAIIRQQLAQALHRWQ